MSTNLHWLVGMESHPPPLLLLVGHTEVDQDPLPVPDTARSVHVLGQGEVGQDLLQILLGDVASQKAGHLGTEEPPLLVGELVGDQQELVLRVRANIALKVKDFYL